MQNMVIEEKKLEEEGSLDLRIVQFKDKQPLGGDRGGSDKPE